jgi:hypothetical protein
MEQPKPDPAPNDDPERKPSHPKSPRGNVEVTPMDEDENIEEGIEVKET